MKSMVCPDLEDPFLPDNEGLMNRIEDCSEAIKDFLIRLPDTFEGTTDVGNCLGPTLQVTYMGWIYHGTALNFIQFR